MLPESRLFRRMRMRRLVSVTNLSEGADRQLLEIARPRDLRSKLREVREPSTRYPNKGEAF